MDHLGSESGHYLHDPSTSLNDSSSSTVLVFHKAASNILLLDPTSSPGFPIDDSVGTPSSDPASGEARETAGYSPCFPRSVIDESPALSSPYPAAGSNGPVRFLPFDPCSNLADDMVSNSCSGASNAGGTDDSTVSPVRQSETAHMPGDITTEGTGEAANDFPATESKRVLNTLPEALLEFIRNKKEPVTETELHNFVRPLYTQLRKPDGCKYNGDIERGVRGCLYSAGIFARTTDKTWTVDEKSAQAYKERLQEKLTRGRSDGRRRKGRRSTKQTENDRISLKGKGVKKGTSDRKKKNEAKDKLVKMISRSYECMKTHALWQQCSQNPFRGLKVDDNDAHGLMKHLGTEKFVILMQMFNFFSDYFNGRSDNANTTLEPDSSTTGNGIADANGARGAKEESIPTLISTVKRLQGVVSKLDKTVSARFPAQ